MTPPDHGSRVTQRQSTKVAGYALGRRVHKDSVSVTRLIVSPARTPRRLRLFSGLDSDVLDWLQGAEKALAGLNHPALKGRRIRRLTDPPGLALVLPAAGEALSGHRLSADRRTQVFGLLGKRTL